MRKILLALTLASLVAAPGLTRAQVVISELMAANDSTIADEDGDYSDWFELYNAGASAVDLLGWGASDDLLDPLKWRFPAVVLEPGEFLLVFCSDKDRSRTGEELHANFRLASAGDSLTLAEPDGTIVWEYDSFPAQVPDFSYGLSMNAVFAQLVRSESPARALVPTSGAAGTSWRDVGFDDSSWLTGDTGVGYDRNNDYQSLINLDVRPQMENENTTAYIRVPFEVTDADRFGGLTLRMKYDDGFAAFINGTQVASANAPGSPTWDSEATGQHDDGDAVIFETFSIGDSSGLLQEGDNVLAIHGLNDNLGSSDFVVMPELDAVGTGQLDVDTRQFFHQPSPGFGNLPGFDGISAAPDVSVPSGVFTGAIDVEITAPGEIRYTLDRSEPDESSPLYTGPIRIDDSRMLRTRAFAAGLSPSPTVSVTYLRVAADVLNFNSDVPIVVVDNFGAGSIPQNGRHDAFMAIFETQADGRARLRNAPELATRIGIKVRGSSTSGRPKPSYTLESWDARGDDQDIAPLGLPEEEDWILYGAYNFDRALMRNVFIYELSNQVGRWAARSRFCEVYVNTGGGSVSASDYAGVYSFMEKIKRDADRVDVERINAADDSEPRVTGGYIMKIDRLDPGDSGFDAANKRIAYVYPKEDDISGPQAQWLRNYMNEFYNVLHGAGFRDPVNGYRKYVDVDAWVDHHILNVLPMNVDALRLSAYFYKTRGGPLEFGPIWDFDRSMGSTDGRDDNPRAWNGTGDATRFFEYPWWSRLFQDPDFWQAWRDRWQELRDSTLSTAHMNSVIDGMALEIQESQARNFQRWGVLGGSSWQQEVQILKNWLTTRSSWIDDQFPRKPNFSRNGGPISPGFELTITAGSGTVYYTTDGSDPRASGGGESAAADEYTGSPIRLDGNARVVARLKSGSSWSGPRAATFVVETPRLVVTELMYHPSDPPLDSPYDDDDFEFLELQNTSPGSIELAGARVEGGIELEFAADEPPLAPDEHIVIVSNLEAFETRYDTAGMRIGGEYRGNLDNDSDSAVILGSLLEPVLEFEYRDAWFPLTDGGGLSLNIADPFGDLASWTVPESWFEGAEDQGTPGEPDPSLGSLGGRQRPGDSNQDGVVDIADAVSLLRRLFGPGAPPLPCDGADLQTGGNLVLLDVNADSGVDVSDVVFLLGYLFQNGPAPALGAGACVRIEGCPSACGF